MFIATKHVRAAPDATMQHAAVPQYIPLHDAYVNIVYKIPDHAKRRVAPPQRIQCERYRDVKITEATLHVGVE